MKKKRTRQQGNTSGPMAEADRVRNVVQGIVNSENSNHDFKFNWEQKELRLPDNPEEASTLEIRKEDMEHY